MQCARRQRHSGPSARRQKTHQTPADTSPTLLMATRNLINMVAVVTTSGAVLLTLLAAKYF
jgi:hypothetical protein